MANIDANEIGRQANRLDEQNEIFVTKTKNIIDNFMEIANIVQSEDSSLSNEIKKLAETYGTLENVLSNKYKDLAVKMHNYSNQSLQIDENITSEVKSTNSTLDGIASQLGSISKYSDEVPQFFSVDFD